MSISKKIIPYGRQSIDKSDILSVLKALKNEKITTGPLISVFESKLSKYLNCKYSITCNSGTSAIFLAMQSICIKKNDIIVMPAINFIASYNIAKLFGARIYLADVDKHTGQMTPQNVEECSKKFRLNKIKAIITMYNGGYPDNVEKFIKLKKKYSCYLIEDACHALGSEYSINKKKYKVGSCKHSDLSTFSLHPLKTITTGEGGIVTTNSKKLSEKIKYLRSLGIKKNKKKHWDYDVVDYGLNLRLNDIQCALGISQLNRIEKFIRRRTEIAKRYTSSLKKISLINLPKFKNNYKSSNHLFIINLKSKSMSLKERFIKFMLKNKVVVQYHYIPIFKFKNFKGKFIGKKAIEYYKSSISIPIYVDLTKKEQDFIINKIKFFFNNND